jgi:hypothetical protein
MEHYSHIRMEAKRKALEGLSPVVEATGPTAIIVGPHVN